MFARFGVFGPIDLVVSGINPGANVGRADLPLRHGRRGADSTQRQRQRRCRQPGGRRLRRRGTGLGRDDPRPALADAPPTSRRSSSASSSPRRRPNPSSSTSTCPTCRSTRSRGWRHAAVAATPPRAIAVGAARADQGHGGLLRHPHGVRRPDHRPVRHRQRGDRARRGGDHLPQPAAPRATRRPRPASTTPSTRCSCADRAGQRSADRA